MSDMKVYKDADNNLVHIGDWDDQNGLNPIPDDWTETTADIVTGYDGGLYASDDPRKDG